MVSENLPLKGMCGGLQDAALAELEETKQEVVAVRAVLARGALAAAPDAAQDPVPGPSNGLSPLKGRTRLCKRGPIKGAMTLQAQACKILLVLHRRQWLR